MSLEEKLSDLVKAIEALTDSNQHLAATIRAAQPLNVPAAAPKAVEGEKRTPGRPPGSGKKKEDPPASPLEQAAAAPSPTSAAPAPAPTPAPTPAASPAPASEGTYADLQVLVPKLAEAQGRSAAVAIFNQLGVESGKDLQAKHPEKIGAAVKLFRAALGE